MPIVKKLVPVDGRMGVVLDVPATDTGSVNILTDEEVEAIRQAEREACAVEAENYSQVEGQARVVGLNIAYIIRARSNNSN